MKATMESSHGYTLSKIDCSSFCLLTWAEKHKSKTTNQFVVISGYCEKLVNTDTCSKLPKGRIFNLWETTDSIAYLELVDRNP